MSTSFTFLGRTRSKGGKLIGDIYGMTYNDGQLMTDVLVAEGVAIAREDNYGGDESVLKHGLRSGLPPSRNGRLYDGGMQEQDARASDSLADSRDQRNVRGAFAGVIGSGAIVADNLGPLPAVHLRHADALHPLIVSVSVLAEPSGPGHEHESVPRAGESATL